MGKQKSGVTYISQEKFDKELNSSVDILIADGADDNTIKEYISDYKSRFAVGEKKNSVSTGTSEEAPSVSPVQQTKAKSFLVGGKPLQTGASASSVGKNKALFGAPVQSFTEQKSKEFKEAKKKEIAVIDKKPVVDITSQFNVKPKTFTEAVSAQVDNDFKVAPVSPLSVVVSEKQKQRKASQQEGLDNYLTKESIDFEDTLAGKGFLNNVENFARGSWNTALSLASNLPFGIGEKASEVIGSTGVVADKTSVDKYFNKAKQEFEKEGKSVTPERLKERAKEIKLKEAKDNYIENQDAEFLNEIKNEEYVDPKSGEVIKIQDALRINDFEKYNTLNKESVKYSNLLKLNKEKVDGFYNDLKQTKNVLNHQIIFGNFDYATDIYNGLLNKEDKNQDDLDFISYYETNKDKAASSPINPNLKQIVSKLEEEIKSKADDFNSVLDTQLNYIEKFDKSFTGKEDAYDDFDNSRRSYDGVFGDKVYLSAAETVNGTIKTIQTLAELSDKLKGKIGLPLQGADSYLFNKVFKDYNYYDFSKELGKQKELVREDVKEVTNSSSLLNYVSDVTATQTGQMALPMLAGYGKVAMPLLRQSAVYFSSGFGRGVGESEEFEERFKRGLVEPGEIGKVHTFAEKLIHGGITGGADILGNLPTALRLSKSFNSLLSKPETANIFWKSWTKKGLDEAKELGTDLLKENTEESLAEIFQDLSRVFVLNEDGVNIGQSIDDVIKDTTTFTLISKIFPLMGRGVINRIASTSDKNKISELEKELYYWKGKLGENVSEETKAIYSDRISKIQSNIDKTNLSIINKVKKDAGGVSAIESLNTEIDNTLQEANKINENKELSKEEKKVLLDAQKELYTSLISNRDALIDGSKTSFDLLPEEQQTKLKTDAAEAIIQEQVDKGIEKDKIQEPNAEVINKKAKELYNQKTQEDAKRKQTDGQITSEEKPTTTAEEQAVSAAQQVDAELQTQKEVDRLRKEEVNELKGGVENPEQFITNGDVDAKKISESDNAKAKEIYAKYDEQIKPLLDNIKTKEDAIQEQTTSEIPIQPETAVGEEVEQGEPETKPEEPTEQGEEKVKPLKEVKSQLQELFSAAKEAISITKNRAKEVDKLKKDLNQFVKSNLVGLDASDIMKSAYQKITSLVQNTNDANFEGQAEKINEIIDDLYLRRELKDEAILDKKIKEASKDTFYKDKTSGKVTKTKVTDEFKKKIEEAKNNFAKINNPTIADKTVFYLEINKLLKDGIKARKAINEARDSKSRENANRLAIISLNKNKSIEPNRTVSMSDGIIDKIFDKFSGGVVFNGKIYLNTKSGKSNFITDTEGLSKVSFNPISTSNVASSAEANRKGFKTTLKDIRRRYSTATFSANKFFEPLFSVEGAKEFLDNNWINRLKVYSEKLGRKVSEFRDVRDNFIKDVIGKENFLNNNRILKSNTYDVIKTARAIFKGGDKSSPLWAFVGRNEIEFSIDVNGKKVEGDYLGIVDELDLMIKKDPSIKKFKDQFVSRYIPFDKMKNEGVAALFNMLRQPEGLNKFLNSYSIDDAKAIISYVNDNPGIREVADKSTKLFENIRDYVNPTLDKLGYDTLGEAKYVSKEDALKIKDDKSTRDLYEILDMVYPNGLPEKIPYYPLSAESLSGTNEGNVLEFFEDSENPNADYSLLFPSLFTRTSGGNLNLNDLSVTRSFDNISKEAITLVQGSDIVSDVRNLYANEGNNVAMISAFGKAWNDKFKTKILNIVRDDAYNTSMGSKDLVGSASRFWVASRSTLRAAQLALNAFSAISQLTGIPIAYAKEGNLKYLKDTLKNLAKKETRNKEFNELKEAYNAIVNSKNYIERTNKRKDNAEVAAIQSINDNLGYRVSGALISDLLIFTTIFDQISVIALTPLYKGKYQADSQTTTTENVDEFFAEEVNKTLQSNAPFYTGTAFYQKWALALGLGGYLQSPRQIMEMISSDVNSMLRKDGDYASKMKRIIAMSSFGLILPIMIKEALRGGDDEEEESKADKKTSILQFGNKIVDSILESMGFAGTLVSSVKNAALIKYSPDVMEMDVNPSDLKSQDIVMQALKGASPNISITMRGIDNVIDKKEIYTNTDQFLFALETGTGFAGAKLKKNIDYVVAAGSESYDYKDYWSLVTGKVTQDEFKQYEKELNTFRETLDKAVYPRLTPNNTLNTSFLNEKQMNELSKMSFEHKAEYIEDIRLNLMRKSVVEQVEFLKKLGGMDKTKGYYKVRESKIKEELSEDAFKLLENKYYSGENLMTVEELTDKLDEFTKEENISEETSLSILKEAIKKANDKISEKFVLPAIKKLDKVSKGRDRAKYIYDNVGDLMEGDNIKYIEMMGDDFDEDTSDEYFEILRKKQNNK